MKLRHGEVTAARRCDDVTLVPVSLHQRSPLTEQLGAALVEPGHVAGGAVAERSGRAPAGVHR